MLLQLYAVCTLIGAAIIAGLVYALASFGSCMTSTGHCSQISPLQNWLLPFLVIISASAINIFVIQKLKFAQALATFILPCLEYFLWLTLYYLLAPGFSSPDITGRLEVLWAELDLHVILGIPIYILAAIQAYIVYKANKRQDTNQKSNGASHD